MSKIIWKEKQANDIAEVMKLLDYCPMSLHELIETSGMPEIDVRRAVKSLLAHGMIVNDNNIYCWSERAQ